MATTLRQTDIVAYALVRAYRSEQKVIHKTQRRSRTEGESEEGGEDGGKGAAEQLTCMFLNMTQFHHGEGHLSVTFVS